MVLEDILQQLRDVTADSPKGAMSPAALAIVDRLCSVFVDSSPQEREKIPPATGWLRISLLAYAWHSAGEAITKHSAELVTKGLIALIIEGGVTDLRDDIMRMAVLFHSAHTLGMDPARIFNEVAELSLKPAVAKEMRSFPARAEQSRALSNFHTRVIENKGEFRYQYEGWPPPRKWWKPWLRR